MNWPISIIYRAAFSEEHTGKTSQGRWLESRYSSEALSLAVSKTLADCFPQLLLEETSEGGQWTAVDRRLHATICKLRVALFGGSQHAPVQTLTK